MTQMEFDFWEFVDCAKCRLPFLSDSGSTVPFWLTECGHVVCNNHLMSNQSCAQCGSPGIQLVPLQREMDAPMSEWFRSAPHALNDIAYSIRFQQESMAAQIRYYKSRHHQQRMFIDKLRHENMQLKRDNDMLSRRDTNYPYDSDMQEPSDVVNPNGKRRMQDQRPLTTSSPRSVVTPVGPGRLTLPPGQQPPHLAPRSSNSAEGAHQLTNKGQQVLHDRPPTGRFIEKYVYNDPAVHNPSQPVSHAQSAPKMIPRSRQNQQLQSNAQPSRHPPHNVPASGKFKAPKQIPPGPMAPPPTPRRGHPQIQSATPASNRFLPPEERFAAPHVFNTSQNIPSSRKDASQRFPSHATFVPPPASRAPSRATQHNNLNGNQRQRMPFVPGAHNDFG